MELFSSNYLPFSQKVLESLRTYHTLKFHYRLALVSLYRYNQGQQQLMGRGKVRSFFSKVTRNYIGFLKSNFQLIKIKGYRSLKHTFSFCIFPGFSLRLKQTGKLPVRLMCQNPGFSLSLFLVALRGMWNLSSPTMD